VQQYGTIGPFDQTCVSGDTISVRAEENLVANKHMTLQKEESLDWLFFAWENYLVSGFYSVDKLALVSIDTEKTSGLYS
jgi:hypothetical protein